VVHGDGEVADRWSNGGRGRGRGDDVAVMLAVTLAGGLAETGNRRRYDIAPLFIRKWSCQRGLRYAVGATRGRGLTSPSDRYRKVIYRRRGRSDMHVGRWMKGARSDGRRVNNLSGRYSVGRAIKYLFFMKFVPGGTLEHWRICIVFQCISYKIAHSSKTLDKSEKWVFHVIFSFERVKGENGSFTRFFSK
jgi:hypothetical protein